MSLAVSRPRPATAGAPGSRAIGLILGVSRGRSGYNHFCDLLGSFLLVQILSLALRRSLLRSYSTLCIYLCTTPKRSPLRSQCTLDVHQEGSVVIR